MFGKTEDIIIVLIWFVPIIVIVWLFSKSMIKVNKKQSLLKAVYSYISLAFFAIVIDAFGIFHPFANILAGIWLLTACYYIGKYGNVKK